MNDLLLDCPILWSYPARLGLETLEQRGFLRLGLLPNSTTLAWQLTPHGWGERRKLEAERLLEGRFLEEGQ